jgi:ribosomal protein L37AE/L43A
MEAMMKRFIPHCHNCGEEYSTKRWKLGYAVCMPCGERLSKQTIRTVVPMHKSNYMMITNMEDLKGINNKGGLHQ